MHIDFFLEEHFSTNISSIFLIITSAQVGIFYDYPNKRKHEPINSITNNMISKNHLLCVLCLKYDRTDLYLWD